MTEKTKYLYIQTFGCQMNVHDSEQMATLLAPSGFRLTDDVGTADVVIVNTCSVRDKAEQKAHSFIGRLDRIKKSRKRMIIGVAGCLAQQWGSDLLTRVPFVDFVLGTHNIHRLPHIVEAIGTKGVRVAETAFHEKVPSLGIPVRHGNGHVTSYVTIMQGCNNFCSFCIVPYVRGREESRRSHEIIDEIEKLAAAGVKEVMLLGQNVNSYGRGLNGGGGFPELLRMIHDIRGIERIRFTTSHPKDLSESLMECFGSLEKLCEHIHLPVQSGSDVVLKWMNRCYTAGEYIDKVQKLRALCPTIAVSSDFIVGFPGEQEEDFEKTIDLMEKVIFDASFSFKYSDRPGTAAVLLDGKVDEAIKLSRLKRLQDLQERHTGARNRALVGSVIEVLIEECSMSSSDMAGRTRTNRIVHVAGDSSLIGRCVPVTITHAYAHSLRGEIVRPGEAGKC